MVKNTKSGSKKVPMKGLGKAANPAPGGKGNLGGNPGVRQFAFANGVSPAAISKALRMGRLTVGADGKLGAAAQKQWDQSRETRKVHIGAVTGLAAARLEREKIRVEKEKLDLAERRGQLVNSHKVEESLTTRFLAFRDRLRRLRDTLPPLLADQPQEHIRQVVGDEIDNALIDLAGMEFSD